MRRFQIPCAALVAGLAVLLSGCAGETPTSPGPGPGQGAGGSPCSTVISLTPSTVSPVTAAGVRATVTTAGVPVTNGSVQFTTDLGFFGENGLQTVSKTIVDGVADVSVFSSFGTAHVTAVFDCARTQLDLQFSGAPALGPFISSVSPTTGSCAGGDRVTILGGRFTGTIDVRFGGASGSIVSATATQIVVTTPAHTPKDPTLPDTVDLVVIAGGAQTAPVPFTFVCALTPVIFSISPTTGPDDTSTRVTIFGTGFQFPMQVFMTGGACGGLVEAQVSDITLTTIVFKTPVATGPNACLAGALAGIQIKNPLTNKTATSPTPFQYFTPPVPTPVPVPTPTPTPTATPTPTPPPPPTVLTTILPNGESGVAYNSALLATGGTPPYTWTLASGALPNGLALSAAGVISGIPTTPGAFPFVVRVRDAVGGTAFSSVLSITIIPPPVIVTTSPLPDGANTTAYSTTLTATGGTPSYTWSLSSGVLPTGLTLSAGGVISGTLAVASALPATFSFSARVTDSAGGTAFKAFAITVN
ncbi:MAG TPA: putative Ig domain-containing protein [Polyangiaceae bacterium]